MGVVLGTKIMLNVGLHMSMSIVEYVREQIMDRGKQIMYKKTKRIHRMHPDHEALR